MRKILKSKLPELIFVIILLTVLYGVFSLPLDRPWRIFAIVTASFFGLIIYYLLFRDLYRGKWLKVAIACAVGAALGAGIVLIRHYALRH